MIDDKIHVPLLDAPKVYVVEMTESEYNAVIDLLADDPSTDTDGVYERMCKAV